MMEYKYRCECCSKSVDTENYNQIIIIKHKRQAGVFKCDFIFCDKCRFILETAINRIRVAACEKENKNDKD